MKRAKIKSIPYEEFKDNETYEKLVEELNAGGANVVVRKLDDLIDWAALTLSGRLRLPRVAAVSSSWPCAPHVTTLHASVSR